MFAHQVFALHQAARSWLSMLRRSNTIETWLLQHVCYDEPKIPDLRSSHPRNFQHDSQNTDALRGSCTLSVRATAAVTQAADTTRPATAAAHPAAQAGGARVHGDYYPWPLSHRNSSDRA